MYVNLYTMSTSNLHYAHDALLLPAHQPGATSPTGDRVSTLFIHLGICLSSICVDTVVKVLLLLFIRNNHEEQLIGLTVQPFVYLHRTHKQKG